jgi:PAS domain S-box-containing protein
VSLFFQKKFAHDTTEEKLRNADFEGQMAAIGRSQAVVSFTTEGVVTEVNQVFLSAMGYTRDEVLGKHHRMFVEEKEARRPEYEAFWRALGEGVAQQGEFKRVAKSGATMWLSSTYTPIISPSGRVVKIVEFAQDFTMQRQNIMLLANMLPSSIATMLKANPKNHIAQHHDEVTVLFADVVGFTAISEKLSALQVVLYLNRIFSAFDMILEQLGIEKIKTIGDAYMAVSGAPVARADHVDVMLTFALRMLEELDKFNAEQGPDEPHFGLRVGVNCGTIVAGVVGTAKFLYDVWGGGIASVCAFICF